MAERLANGDALRRVPGEQLGDEVEVPTLHVLYSTSEQNSVITRPYPTPDILQVREQLLDWIAEEALGGDREAAEWILLSTIARV